MHPPGSAGRWGDFDFCNPLPRRGGLEVPSFEFCTSTIQNRHPLNFAPYEFLTSNSTLKLRLTRLAKKYRWLVNFVPTLSDDIKRRRHGLTVPSGLFVGRFPPQASRKTQGSLAHFTPCAQLSQQTFSQASDLATHFSFLRGSRCSSGAGTPAALMQVLLQP